MPHPELTNKTGFAFEVQLLSDEDGVPQFVTCVQATYTFGTNGLLALVEEQPKVLLGGQWRGDPAVSSLIHEPQIAFTKLATDIVLRGHAYPTSSDGAEGLVGIRVGPMQKTAHVFGDRRVVRRLGIPMIGRPQPFERLPIVYERAFGGWDRSDADPLRHRQDARNPVGVGLRAHLKPEGEDLLPNFEDPQHLMNSVDDTPPPVGFGFIAPNWQPRAGFAGNYDAAWVKNRKPLLPRDFDRRFFNAASPGLIAPGHLRGDEPVVVIGAALSGRVAFNLPGVPAPVCRVGLRGRRWRSLPTVLDTVTVDMDAETLTLMWRAYLPVRNGMHDVLAVEVHPDADAAAQAEAAWVALCAEHARDDSEDDAAEPDESEEGV